MKTIKLIVTGIFLLMLSFGLQAQPDPPGGGHGSGEDQGPGGGAPVGSGLVIMTILTAAYGGKKAYNLKRKTELEN
jgi:hypothetical protein